MLYNYGSVNVRSYLHYCFRLSKIEAMWQGSSPIAACMIFVSKSFTIDASSVTLGLLLFFKLERAVSCNFIGFNISTVNKDSQRSMNAHFLSSP